MLDTPSFVPETLAPGALAAEAFPLDPAALAAAIDIALDQWPGNCHTVASAVLALVPVPGMRLVRGHWHGQVSRKSVYRGGPCQHSWLELADGRILDPTRWAMERPGRPEIYLGVNDVYDEAGRQLVASRPPMLPGGRDGLIDRIAGLDPAARAGLATALAGEGCRFLPVDIHGSEVPADRLTAALRSRLDEPVERLRAPATLYAALANAGLKALVPIDCWLRVMEPERVTVRAGANRVFALPPRAPMTDTAQLAVILGQFLTLEARPDLEEELEEFGLGLDEVWGAMAWLDRLSDLEIAHLPRSMVDPLAVPISDLLGRGFGTGLKVERFAASLGLDLAGLDALLRRFGDRVGMSIGWL